MANKPGKFRTNFMIAWAFKNNPYFKEFLDLVHCRGLPACSCKMLDKANMYGHASEKQYIAIYIHFISLKYLLALLITMSIHFKDVCAAIYFLFLVPTRISCDYRPVY